MYAKIKNGKIEKYPYTAEDIRKDFPNTSFCVPLTTEVAQEFGFVQVEPTAPPAITYTQQLEEDSPALVGGVWTQVWKIVNIPAEQAKQRGKELRARAFREEADPLFFQWQRGKATQKDWMDKVAEIEARYPE